MKTVVVIGCLLLLSNKYYVDTRGRENFWQGTGGRGQGGGRECKTCQLKGRIKKVRRDERRDVD